MTGQAETRRAPFARRLFDILPRLVPLVLLLDLAIGMMVPVYSDEVGWRLQERAGLDGVDKLYSTQCGPTTFATPAAFMWPVRWYSALFNSLLPDPFWVRLSGVGYAITFIALLILLTRRIATDTVQRQWLPVIACGLMGFGVLPWLLIWSRPEQPILLALVATLFLAMSSTGLDPARGERSFGFAWRPIVIAALWAISLSYHFKTLVLLPIYLLAIAFQSLGKGRRWTGAVAGLAVIGMATVGVRYWFHRIDCPGDPLLATFYSSQNLGAQLLLGQSPARILLALVQNFKLPVYIAMSAPDAAPMDDWLVAHQISKTGQFAWVVAIMFFWLAGFVVAARRLFPVLALALRRRELPLGAGQRALLSIMCFASATAYCLSQIVRNDYESCFVLPLLLLSCLSALSLPAATAEHPEAAAKSNLTTYARATGLAMLFSVVGVGVLFGGSLWRGFGQSGYLPEQPNSVAVRGYGAWRDRITATARLCAIEPDAAHPRLLIDSVTYFAMMRAPLPDHKTSVLDLRYSGQVKDPALYLAKNQSSGVVVGCQWLPPALRARARTGDGRICCLAPSDFAPTRR